MRKMSIKLPQTLKEHIDRRVAQGEFTSPGDYVRALVRADRSRSERRDTLVRDIDAGLADIDAGRVYDGEEVFREFLQATNCTLKSCGRNPSA